MCCVVRVTSPKMLQETFICLKMWIPIMALLRLPEVQVLNSELIPYPEGNLGRHLNGLERLGWLNPTRSDLPCIYIYNHG